MESISTKNLPLNILIPKLNPKVAPKFEKIIEPLKQKYPQINYYYFSIPINESEIESLKSKNISVIYCRPHLATSLPYLIKNLPTIKWVHSLSAGVDRYFKVPEFVEKIKNKEIIFTNNRGAYSEIFAEAGIVDMIYFSYNIYTYIDGMNNKNWIKPFPTNKMLQNKKLLIIGYGNNGICLAKIAKNGFGMKIIGVVRTIRENINGKEFVDVFYTLKNLPDKIINEADFIYATLPSTPETINIFDKNFFKKMNKDGVFINIGRGTAVVENDIVDALENNIIRGAALDVTQNEPLEKESKLYNVSPNKLLITNHSIGIVDESLERGLGFFMKCLEYYLENGEYKNIVNIDNQY